MTLDAGDIAKVALLARLRLGEQESATMVDELGAIVSYIDQLNELDTDGVEPMAHAIEAVNVFADDEPAPSLPRESALANAPNRDDECYRVPAVLGDGG